MAYLRCVHLICLDIFQLDLYINKCHVLFDSIQFKLVWNTKMCFFGAHNHVPFSHKGSTSKL